MSARTVLVTLKSVVIAYLITFILLFAFNWISYTREDPRQLLSILGYAALFIGSFTGGFITQKSGAASPIVSGLLSGAFFIFIAYCISLAVEKAGEGRGAYITLAVYGGALLFAVLGAVAAAKRRASYKKIRKKNKKKYSV